MSLIVYTKPLMPQEFLDEQWRVICTKRDPVTLPLELFHQIVSYLPIRAIFQSVAVSHQWQRPIIDAAHFQSIQQIENFGQKLLQYLGPVTGNAGKTLATILSLKRYQEINPGTLLGISQREKQIEPAFLMVLTDLSAEKIEQAKQATASALPRFFGDIFESALRFVQARQTNAQIRQIMRGY